MGSSDFVWYGLPKLAAEFALDIVFPLGLGGFSVVVMHVVTVLCDFKLAKFDEAVDMPEVVLDTDDRLVALVYLGTKGLSNTNISN